MLLKRKAWRNQVWGKRQISIFVGHICVCVSIPMRKIVTRLWTATKLPSGILRCQGTYLISSGSFCLPSSSFERFGDLLCQSIYVRGGGDVTDKFIQNSKTAHATAAACIATAVQHIAWHCGAVMMQPTMTQESHLCMVFLAHQLMTPLNNAALNPRPSSLSALHHKEKHSLCGFDTL